MPGKSRLTNDYHLAWLRERPGANRDCTPAEQRTCDPQAQCFPSGPDSHTCACIESYGFNTADSSLVPTGLHGRREPHGTCAKSFIAMCGSKNPMYVLWDKKTQVWEQMFASAFATNVPAGTGEAIVSCPVGCNDGRVQRSPQGTYTMATSGVVQGIRFTAAGSDVCSAAADASGTDGSGQWRIRQEPAPDRAECSTTNHYDLVEYSDRLGRNLTCVDLIALDGMSCSENFAPGRPYAQYCNHLCGINRFDAARNGSNTCQWSWDGVCDDGSTGLEQFCVRGTDMGDCTDDNNTDCAYFIDRGILTCEQHFGPGGQFEGLCDFECGFCGGCGIGAVVVARRSNPVMTAQATIVKISNDTVEIEWRQDDSCEHAHDGQCDYCTDDTDFIDEGGYVCEAWAGYDCDSAMAFGYTEAGSLSADHKLPLDMRSLSPHTTAQHSQTTPIVLRLVPTQHALRGDTIKCSVKPPSQSSRSKRLVITVMSSSRRCYRKTRTMYDALAMGFTTSAPCLARLRTCRRCSDRSLRSVDTGVDTLNQMRRVMTSCSGRTTAVEGCTGWPQWIYAGQTLHEGYTRECNLTAACEACKDLPRVFNPHAEPPHSCTSTMLSSTVCYVAQLPTQWTTTRGGISVAQ